jgi:CDP-glucose 4,6-dehydratase
LLLEAMGHEVIGYSLAATPDSLYTRLDRKSLINETIGDIRDMDLLTKAVKSAKPSIVIHLAAQALVLKSYEFPRETFEINTQGTANLFEAAFSTSSVRTIGAVTTDKVYKNIDTDHAYVESDPLEGSSDPYSASKVAAEAVICGYRKISDSYGGPNITTLRSGNVIGGGDFSEDRLIPDMVRSYLTGAPIQVRNPNSTRPWMHVLDSLIGYLEAIAYTTQNQDNEVFNFAPLEQSLSVQEVLDISIQEWPSMFRVEFSAATKAKSEARLLSLNSTKATLLLNWKPIWNQEDSIRDSIQWWKAILEKSMTANDVCAQAVAKVVNRA